MLAAFLLAGALFVGAVPVHGQEDRAREVALEVLKDPAYQGEMPPHDKVDLDSGRPDPGNAGSDQAPVELPAVAAETTIGQTVFIILIGAVVLLLVGWLVQAGVRGRRDAVESEIEPPPGENPAVPVREPAFDEATRLAAEGRFAEAVHALLLASIRHFAERSRVAVPPSRTSRELIRLLPLGAEARAAFSDLVRTVELSLFGGAAVGREEYEQSLSRFRELTRRAA